MDLDVHESTLESKDTKKSIEAEESLENGNEVGERNHLLQYAAFLYFWFGKAFLAASEEHKERACGVSTC